MNDSGLAEFAEAFLSFSWFFLRSLKGKAVRRGTGLTGGRQAAQEIHISRQATRDFVGKTRNSQVTGIISFNSKIIIM